MNVKKRSFMSKSSSIARCFSNFPLGNKKGMYFTLMTIAFLFIFIFIFMIPGYKRSGEKMSVIEMRVDSMNDFIKDLERDTERGLYISSFRALLALEQQIITHGEFLDDVDSSFKQALLNGTVNQTPSMLMLESTFQDWIDTIGLESQNFNIRSNINFSNINIYQHDPWNVGVSANMSFSIVDETGIASWKRNRIINTSISILYFEDPTYMVYSYGRTTNTINMTPFEGNYTYQIGENWYVDNLMAHAENSYYTANSNAPDFLHRLEKNGINTQSDYGIESLVNIVELSGVGLDICTTCSIVDYLYWDEAEGNYRINQTPSWYRVDNAHRARYNVTGLSYLD